MSSPARNTSADDAPPPAQPTPTIRRSFTLPTRVVSRPRPSLPASRDSADGIETLFTHTNTKIVSFTTGPSTGTPPPNSRRSIGDVDIDTPGSIPWKSFTERTLAVGPLRIYRVISSNVSFLNSGNFLHTIFPKSQCWCVDGECKFVLRIRQNSYYRIELPFGSDEDREKVEEFKTVVDKVLRYEKTACPFARGFEVELPEEPTSPVRKRTPKPAGKAKKWLFDKTWVPETGPRPLAEESDSGTMSSVEEDDRSSANMAEQTDGASDSPPRISQTPAPAPKVVSVPDRVRDIQLLRSVTVPTELLVPPIPPSISPDKPPSPEIPEQTLTPPENIPSADAVSIMSSADSFYSLDKTISRTPSPPYLDAQADMVDNPWVEEYMHETQKEYEDSNQMPKDYGKVTHTQEQPVDTPSRGRERHRRQISDVTVRAPSTEQSAEALPVTPTIEVGPSSAPSTPPLVSDSDDSLEPPFLDVPTPPNTIRLRKLTGATQRRAFSPMPPPQNLFRPAAVQAPRTQFTAALVRKTCEIILGPPAHLVALMLRIAAKVTNSAARFNTYRKRRNSERIPGTWESSDEEWDEDDFGIPLRTLDESVSRSTSRQRAGSSGLEVD